MRPPDSVLIDRDGPVAMVVINRPARRNAVDEATAAALDAAFADLDADDDVAAAVLAGAEGTFCSGADLTALAAGDPRDLTVGARGPMGPTRRTMSKPVIAAIEGYAVAGGLELALWADLRVAARTASLGVLNRRFGVPLIDMGTIRLPRLVGQGRALDLVLTGRLVDAVEAHRIGLVERLADHGGALDAAVALAASLAAFPQGALRGDRRSVLEQWGMETAAAAANEARIGAATIASGETAEGARSFAAGSGRSGAPLTDD